MRLQPFIEIVRAPACDEDRHEEEHDGYDGEDGQCLAGRRVVGLALCVSRVHADELEDKICERDEVHKLVKQLAYRSRDTRSEKIYD